MSKEPGWKEIPIGGVIVDAGCAEDYKTGGWRVERPIHDAEKCTNCLICWIMCPDSSILVKDGKVASIDYEHCKGCGICAEECPDKIKAFKMVSESEFD